MMSEDRKKAASERMKIYHANKKAAQEALQVPSKQKDDERTTQEPQTSQNASEQLTALNDPNAPETQEEPTISQTEYADLLKEIAELKKSLQMKAPDPRDPRGPQVGPRGKLTGTFEKYVIDPKYYQDPTDRLALEPRLQRFAFLVNYELEWDVARSQYQTIDGINTVEPKFTVKLVKVVLDEDTGLPTNQRYVLRSMVLHEDPQSALMVARDNGLDPEEFGGERQFLDEMRYLRIRDWLIDAFYPPKRTDRSDTKEAVIGNRVVRIYEKSSTEPQAIKFER